MKKILSIILVLIVISTLCLSFVSCTDGENEEETDNVIVESPEDGDENETVKQPEGSGETQDWGIGEVPLN